MYACHGPCQAFHDMHSHGCLHQLGKDYVATSAVANLLQCKYRSAFRESASFQCSAVTHTTNPFWEKVKNCEASTKTPDGLLMSHILLMSLLLLQARKSRCHFACRISLTAFTNTRWCACSQKSPRSFLYEPLDQVRPCGELLLSVLWSSSHLLQCT